MVLEQIANLSAVNNGFGVQVPGTPPRTKIVTSKVRNWNITVSQGLVGYATL